MNSTAILEAMKHTVCTIKTDPHYIYVNAPSNLNNNLFLQTGSQVQRSHYKKCNAILKKALRDFKLTHTDYTETWSQFTLNTVPTNLSLADIKTSLLTKYPGIPLARDSRWQLFPTLQDSKHHFSIIFILTSSHTLESVYNSSLIICSNHYSIHPYYMQTKATSCAHCQ